jgi:hypothetical protein
MSSDSTRPDYKTVQPFDVSDENPKHVARRLDQLTTEVRTGFEGINNQLLPAINRINDALADIAVRLNRLEKDRDDHAMRLVALEQSAKQRLKAARKK